MACFAPGMGNGVKQRCDRVEFIPGHSNRARLCGDLADLAEDLIGIAV